MENIKKNDDENVKNTGDVKSQEFTFINFNDFHNDWVLEKSINNKSIVHFFEINIIIALGFLALYKYWYVMVVFAVFINFAYFKTKNNVSAVIYDKGIFIFNGEEDNYGQAIPYESLKEYGYDNETNVAMVFRFYDNEKHLKSARLTTGNADKIYKILNKKMPEKDSVVIKTKEFSDNVDKFVGAGPVYTFVQNMKKKFKK